MKLSTAFPAIIGIICLSSGCSTNNDVSGGPDTGSNVNINDASGGPDAGTNINNDNANGCDIFGYREAYERADSLAGDIYADFNHFSIDNFGAEHEPLTYEVNGNDLAFNESSTFVHESENSVVLGFETNLPSITFVEYGETSDYGEQTEIPERFFYLHLHYLKDLKPNTTYHYRTVAIDERCNVLRSEDRTLQTRTMQGAVYIPGTMNGPPYVLDQNDTTYVLTEDIVSDTRGITITGDNVTLDLNGHTITYDNGAPLVSGTWDEYIYSDVSTFGIFGHGSGIVTGTILNGQVVQGESSSQGNIGIGFNPIYVSSGAFEIAGMTVRYTGHSVGGISARYGNHRVHHNVVIDGGTGIDNRHQGVKAIWSHDEGGNLAIYNNLVKRARQQGIRTGGYTHSNEVYSDSYDTNSFGIVPAANQTIENNRIFGTGYHVVAIGWAKDTDSMTIRNNFVHLQGDAPTTRSDEYGSMASVNGFRLTQYAGSTERYEGYLYEGNTIIVKGRNGTTTMRGVQFFSDPHVSGLVFRNNIIKTEVLDDVTEAPAACVVGHGLSDRHDTQLPILYRNNRFISNRLHVRFGDSYASGGNHHFRNNTFERLGNRSDYVTIQIGAWIYHSYNNLFLDNAMEEGTDLENNLFDTNRETAILEYAVGHSLYILAQTANGDPIVNTPIRVEDNTGTRFEGVTGVSGVSRIELLEYGYEALEGTADPTRVLHENHTINIDGYSPYVVSPSDFAIRDNENEPLVTIF